MSTAENKAIPKAPFKTRAGIFLTAYAHYIGSGAVLFFNAFDGSYHDTEDAYGSLFHGIAKAFIYTTVILGSGFGLQLLKQYQTEKIRSKNTRKPVTFYTSPVASPRPSITIKIDNERKITRPRAHSDLESARSFEDYTETYASSSFSNDLIDEKLDEISNPTETHLNEQTSSTNPSSYTKKLAIFFAITGAAQVIAPLLALIFKNQQFLAPRQQHQFPIEIQRVGRQLSNIFTPNFATAFVLYFNAAYHTNQYNRIDRLFGDSAYSPTLRRASDRQSRCKIRCKKWTTILAPALLRTIIEIGAPLLFIIGMKHLLPTARPPYDELDTDLLMPLKIINWPLSYVSIPLFEMESILNPRQGALSIHATHVWLMLMSTFHLRHSFSSSTRRNSAYVIAIVGGILTTAIGRFIGDAHSIPQLITTSILVSSISHSLFDWVLYKLFSRVPQPNNEGDGQQRNGCCRLFRSCRKDGEAAALARHAPSGGYDSIEQDYLPTARAPKRTGFCQKVCQFFCRSSKPTDDYQEPSNHSYYPHEDDAATL